MEQFIKSLTRFSWAISRFGVRQLANTLPLRDPGQYASRMAGAFDAVTRATEEQLDGFIKGAFRVGDQLQRDAVDLCCDTLTPDAFTPRRLTRTALGLLQQSAEAIRRFAPGQEDRLNWQEFQNKLEAFDLFEHVDTTLRLTPTTRAMLTDLVEQALGLEPYRSVWAMEGVGHYFAETAWEWEEMPHRLLNGGQANALPARSMIPLHAGLGLSLANRVLATVSSSSQDDKMRQALRQFIALCQGNARSGYTGTAYEALGLVARNLYPQMVTRIDQLLTEISEELVGYFWHGVGRAIYFAPTNFVPCTGSGQRAIETAEQEPPHALARRNVLAGLAWAITLVNIRQPQIMETFLPLVLQRRLDEDAFANGVSCAVMVWHDTAPDDPDLDAFCRYQPPLSDPGMASLWNRLVGEPCARSLQHYYEAIKAHDCFGELFRHQSLPQLIGKSSVICPDRVAH